MPKVDPPATHIAPSGPKVRARRSWRGWVWWPVRIAAILALALAVLTQSGVLGWLILPQVEAALGCEAHASRVSLTSSGVLLIRNLRLSVPGMSGPSGTFFQAPLLEVTPRWGALLAGTIPVQQVTAHAPTFRISFDERFSPSLAKLRSTAGGANLTFIPGVHLTNAVLELGEHDSSTYTPLVSLKVQGSISADPKNPSRYQADLRELPAVGPDSTEADTANPLRLHGEFDLTTSQGALELSNVDLSRSRALTPPRRIAPLWSKLAISGGIEGATFGYTPKDGIVTSFSLQDVNLNIPVPAVSETERARIAMVGGPARDADDLLAMRRVSGDLRFTTQGMRAQLKGQIEDLPCEVSLQTEGYSLDSPLSCRIVADQFNVKDRPGLLPFSPFYVHRNFKRFSGPTAMVNGEVMLSRARATPDGPAPLKVSGRIEFEKGAAAFEKFPYTFEEMRGTIVFTDEEVRILGITGRGPTGARMLAVGRVAPPTDGGSVEVDVTVVDAPTDEHLVQAIPEHRRSLLDNLFSPTAYAGLLAAGLVASHEDGRAPRFSPGGVCTIQVKIRRGLGQDATYETDVAVNMPRAGLISKVFPYPVEARDFELLISDSRVSARSASLRGISGARGALECLITLGDREKGVEDSYDVRVHVDDVPIDAYLLHALPAKKPSAKPGELGARTLIRDLGLRGAVDCDARVWSARTDDPDYDIHVQFNGLEARPGEGCLTLDALSGDLIISNQDIQLVDLAGKIGEGVFAADLGALQADDDAAPMEIRTRVGFANIELSEAVEDLVAVVAPAEGARLRGFRSEYRPEGSVDGSLDLRVERGETLYDLRFSSLRDLRAMVLGGPLETNDEIGGVRLSQRGVRFDDFRTSLHYDGVESGALRLDGEWPIDPARQGALSIDWSGARLESPLTRRLAARVSPKAEQWATKLEIQGVFGARGMLQQPAGGEPGFEGVIEPRSLGLRYEGVSINFDQVDGAITLGPGGGRVDALRAGTRDWSVQIEGGWATQPGIDVDLRASLRARGLPDELKAAIPGGAKRVIEGLSLELMDSLTIDSARIRYSDPPKEGPEPVLRVEATGNAASAALSLGVPIQATGLRAMLDGSWVVRDPAGGLRLKGVVEAQSLVASGVSMSEGLLTIESGNEPGQYLVPSFEARVHGGTITGSASVFPAAPAPGGGAAGDEGSFYQARMQAAGLDFATLLAELAATEASSTGNTPGSANGESTPSAASQPPKPVVPGSRGRLDASLTLEGSASGGPGRRGSGFVRVSGGSVIELPGLMPLLRLSNLQPPMGESLESALASFYLRDRLLTFDRLEASSKSLQLVGEGTMTWPEMLLDLRFNSQGRSYVPIISDVFQGLRNELVTTVVSGTLRDPEYRLESLSGTQKMLGSIFQGEQKPAHTPGPSPEPRPATPITPTETP